MSSESGQSLLEVITASAVGILVVTALTVATIFSLRNATFAKNSIQATKLAQEGIERVRSGRDRDASISPITNCPNLSSWNGNSATSGSDIWSCQITGSGRCDVPAAGLADASKCYFTVSSAGALSYINSWTTFPTSSYEGIPTANPKFKRVILLSDDANYQTQKTVTVIVQWTDFAGPHESKLTTILRKI